MPSAAGTAGAPAADGGERENPTGLTPLIDAGPRVIELGPCDTTFQMIARVVFDGSGCSHGVCHTTPGPDTPAGGLDLTEADAYRALIDVPARAPLAVPLVRVKPGDEQSSLLFLKLAAAEPHGPALPSGGGAPMPLGLPPLAADYLEALRAWIHAGAQESGVTPGTESLVDECRRMASAGP